MQAPAQTGQPQGDAPAQTEHAPTPPPGSVGRWTATGLTVSLDDRRVLITVTGTKDLGLWQRWRAQVVITPRSARPVSREEDGYSFPSVDERNGADEYFQMPRQLARDIVTGLPGAEARVASMSDFVQQIARDLEQVVAPRGLRAARAFADPQVWWFVYAVASDDATGRVAQLAEVCPGLLLMAFSQFQEHSMGASQQIFEGAVKGLRLSGLLETAARAWLDLHLVRLANFELPEPTPDACVQLVSSQRVRIRRAGARVPVALLLEPPPPAMVPGDIPTSPEQNSRWYTYTSHPALPWLADPHPRMITQRQQAGLSRFLSRWWLELSAFCHPSERDDPEGLLGHIVDFLEATGRVIDRKTRPTRLIDEMDRWVMELGQPRRLHANLPLQTHGLTEWKGPAGTIRPLTTVAELWEESRIMSHCVAAMAARGVAGQAVFLHGEIHERPVTIELRPDRRGFHMTDAKGIRNRSLHASEKEALACWLNEVNTNWKRTRSEEGPA